MSIMKIFNRNRITDSGVSPDDGVLDGPNPSDDVLEAAKEASRQILHDRRVGRISILTEHKAEPFLHNSVVSGEVPMITPGMERPKD